MAVLICGGAGYIGSHVNKMLSRLGRETVVFDNLVYGHREAVKWGSFIEGDLKNPEEIGAVIEKYPIEAVRKVTRKDFLVTLAERRPGDSATLMGGSKKAREALG